MPYSYDDEFPVYISVQQRRDNAERYVARQKKRGHLLSPVLPIDGTLIARTFWGKSWCKHLEQQADLENRLERGRSYARHGAVVDLRIEPGRLVAQVLGSEIYQVEVSIKPLPKKRWSTLVNLCHDQIDSLVDLLQGHLSPAVMELMVAPNTGVLPASSEIKFTCSCPDHASMCKHVSAVLYAAGSRLDTAQTELFVLRQVDHTELVQQATRGATHLNSADDNGLDGEDLSALFGIDLGETQQLAPAKVDKKAAGSKTKRRKATKAAAHPKPTSRKKKASTTV